MDLSRLTRPAILCQCSRCSSSIAALENEWARLSNSYSLAAGWLSVELHRIAISHEKKIIPQSSDLVILRGRTLQEVSCKLCQQKLGVLGVLDNGPNIFWKLSKISFREIVTMRTVEPTFIETPLERLLAAPPKEPSTRRDRSSMQAGAVVPTGPMDLSPCNMSVEEQIQHQGLNIDYISSSVNNLHDTMSELKGAFTALRIELNGPNRPPEPGMNLNNDFNMVTTVLRELRAKSDEIERLKLENEALKLRNRYADDHNVRLPSYVPPMEMTTVPEVQSPGLLQGSRKRPWPDSWPMGRTDVIADTFDDNSDDDSIGDFSLAESTILPVKIPLRGPEPDPQANEMAPDPESTQDIRVENGQQTPQLDSGTKALPTSISQQQPIYKRPRLSQPATSQPPSSGNSEKKKAGRPRKSISGTPKTDHSQPSKNAPLNEQAGNVGSNAQKENSPAMATPSDQGSTKENRSTRRRPSRSRSRAPSLAAKNQGGPDSARTPQQDQPEGVGGESAAQQKSSEKQNATMKSVNGQVEKLNEEDQGKRKARVAHRDVMVRLAMQREEAMDTESR